MKRQDNLQQARIKLSSGDVAGANELYQRAVEITPLMAYELIKVLRVDNVEFVVAPYEADAQLAFLSKLSPENGGISAVISEDSDLLAYGCQTVIFKMDRFGNGDEIQLKKVFYPEVKAADSLSFRRFSQSLFTGMCVLAGCDFLPSVPGIGIKRAHELVSKYLNLDRVLSRIRSDPKLVFPEGYQFEFKQAVAIFQHARVYDAKKRGLCFLTALPSTFSEEFGGDIGFLGPDLPKSIAAAIAEGRVDPTTMCAFEEQPLRSIKKTVVLDGGYPKSISSEDSLVIISGIEELLDIDTSGSSGMVMHRSRIAASKGNMERLCVKSEEAENAEISEDRQHVPTIGPDRSFIVQLQLLAENSLKNLQNQEEPEFYPEYSEDMKGKRGIDGSVTTYEKRGLKRVLPPCPSNNPFRKTVANKENGHLNRITIKSPSKLDSTKSPKKKTTSTIDLTLSEDRTTAVACAEFNPVDSGTISHDHSLTDPREFGPADTSHKVQRKMDMRKFITSKEKSVWNSGDFQAKHKENRDYTTASLHPQKELKLPFDSPEGLKRKQERSIMHICAESDSLQTGISSDFQSCFDLGTVGVVCTARKFQTDAKHHDPEVLATEKPDFQAKQHNSLQVRDASIQTGFNPLSEKHQGKIKVETKASTISESGIRKFFKRTILK